MELSRVYDVVNSGAKGSDQGSGGEADSWFLVDRLRTEVRGELDGGVLEVALRGRGQAGRQRVRAQAKSDESEEDGAVVLDGAEVAVQNQALVRLEQLNATLREHRDQWVISSGK